MADFLTVLCVGTPPDLRASRQQVLQSAGYDVSSIDAVEAIDTLLTKAFDVVVISMTVSERGRNLIRKAVPERTRIVQLSYFTSPEELLEMVQLQPSDD